METYTDDCLLIRRLWLQDPSVCTEKIMIPHVNEIGCKQETLLYANKTGHHGSRGGGFRSKFEDLDWGNSKRHEGVCWRCGRSGYIAQNCVANMPADVKECILNHHTHFTTSELDDIAHAHLATDNINSATLAPTVLSQDQLTHFAPNDPLVLALSANHQAHTVIDSAWRIFGPDEDVPLEFQTTDGYVSNN